MPIGDVPSIGALTVNPKWKVAIVRSLWHGAYTSAMAEDARKALIDAGVPQKNIVIIDASGSFEVPLLAGHAIERLKVDGVIALGVIVQGETHHAEIIAKESARGCMELQMKTGKPVAFEILFVDALKDAEIRSMGEHGKGKIAAQTLLGSLAEIAEMH